MALAMLMVQKQELLTKIENENISRKQDYTYKKLALSKQAGQFLMKTPNFDKQAESFL